MGVIRVNGPQGWQDIPYLATYEVKAPDAEVWHYTTGAGLLGMVRSSMVWASSPLSLNDSSEIKYGARVVAEAWASIRDGWSSARLQHGDELAREWAIEDAAERVFFLCASKVGDSLNQWQGYSRSRGYAVKLRVSDNLAIVLDVHDSEAVVSGIAPGWHEVVYERSRQLEMARDLLSFLVGIAPEHAALEEAQVISHFRILATLVTRFKPEAFASENEVRYVVALPDNLPHGFREKFPEKFRDGPRGLVPYVDLAATATRQFYVRQPSALLPITEVMCGPASEDDQKPIIAAASRLMLQHGYHARVSSSAIPYRFA